MDRGGEQVGRSDPEKFLGRGGNMFPEAREKKPDTREQSEETAGVAEEGRGIQIGPGFVSVPGVLKKGGHGEGFFVV